MRVGILGGTFDPIHLGHLRAAERAREALGLDLVRFVPAHVPPHRTAPVASARDRYAMVCLAVAGQPGFVPDDVELRREGPSYTVDTLEELLAGSEDTAYVIVGSDSHADLGHWKRPERVKELCSLIVVERPGRPPTAVADGAQRVSGGLPISATAIRELLGRGRSVSFLVPPGVADYIQKRELYR